MCWLDLLMITLWNGWNWSAASYCTYAAVKIKQTTLFTAQLKCHLWPQQDYKTQLKCHLWPQQDYKTQLKCHLWPQQDYKTQLKCHLWPQQDYKPQLHKQAQQRSDQHGCHWWSPWMFCSPCINERPLPQQNQMRNAHPQMIHICHTRRLCCYLPYTRLIPKAVFLMPFLPCIKASIIQKGTKLTVITNTLSLKEKGA